MATTRYKESVAGGLPKTVKFDVTADNDVLVENENAIVLGAFFEGLATALNLDAGVDITELPAQVADTEQLCVTTTGDGSVTLVMSVLPDAGFATHDN